MVTRIRYLPKSAHVALIACAGVGCTPLPSTLRNMPAFPISAVVVHQGTRRVPIEEQITLSDTETVTIILAGEVPRDEMEAIQKDRDANRRASRTYVEDVMISVHAMVTSPDDFSIRPDDVICRDRSGQHLDLEETESPSYVSRSVTVVKVFRLRSPELLMFGEPENWYEIEVTFRYRGKTYRRNIGRVWFSREERTHTGIG